MAKFKISIDYIFTGVIEVEAKNELEARENVLKNCGFSSKNGFHSTLSDSTLLDWEFSMIGDSSITKLVMTIDNLQEFFENEEFNVHLFEQDGEQNAEIEKWTNGGVDMIIVLMPFTKEKFIEYVNEFDIDREIELHREGKDYKNNFTISQGLKDFTDFHNHLKEIVAKL